MPKDTQFRTLHEAILFLLRSRSVLSFEEISALIREQNLWRRKSDGAYPDVFQIRLRTIVNKKYKTHFKENSDGTISSSSVR